MIILNLELRKVENELMKILSNKKYNDLIHYENELKSNFKKLFELEREFENLNNAIIMLAKQNKILQEKIELKEKQRRQNASKIGGLTKQLNELRRKNEKNNR